MSTSGLKSGCSSTHDSVLPPVLQEQCPGLSHSQEILPGQRSAGTQPKFAERMSGKGAVSRTVHRRPGCCSWVGVGVQGVRGSPPWGKAALTAQRDQAQVQRRAFPVTELCASESREFLFCLF